MRRRNRKFMSNLLQKIKHGIVAIFIIGCSIFMIVNCNSNKVDNTVKHNTTQNITQTRIENDIKKKRQDIDIQKVIYEQRVSDAKNFINSVSNKTELIIYEANGTMKQHLDKTPNDNGILDFGNSELDVNVEYKVIMSIPTSKISLTVDKNGLVECTYDIDNIRVKAIETKNTISENKRMFGKEYTEDEKQAVCELMKDKLRADYNSSLKIKQQCEKNLNQTVKDIAKKFNVHSVCFNSGAVEHLTGYEFKDMSNVRYGWDRNKELDDIKYVCIHSTSNLDKDGITHIKWLNTDENANATHFYVDDKEIIKALELDKYAWGVGNGGNGIFNGNSIQIEMCEFSDADKQEKVFENTIEFVRDVLLPSLKKQGYEVKVVNHHMSTGKNCPRVLYDGKCMEWKEFYEKIMN